MADSIFRKKSIDRVASPEQLNDYVRVVTPGIWMALGAIIVLLAGALVWASFGQLEDRISVYVVSENSEVVCYIPEEKISEVKIGAQVEVNGTKGTVTQVSGTAVNPGDADINGIFARSTIGDSPVYAALCDLSLEDGAYDGELTVGGVSPISFLFN